MARPSPRPLPAQVVSDSDGECYALRRAEGGSIGSSNLEKNFFSTLHHPNLVRFHEAFNSDEEGTTHTYFVHHYYPGAVTLETHYFANHSPVVEDTIWAHTLQLLAAMHAVHLAGGALRQLVSAHRVASNSRRVASQ